jgi:hypothetical protein
MFSIQNVSLFDFLPIFKGRAKSPFSFLSEGKRNDNSIVSSSSLQSACGERESFMRLPLDRLTVSCSIYICLLGFESLSLKKSADGML